MALSSPRLLAKTFPVLPTYSGNEAEWRWKVEEVVNNNGRGKINATGSVTLTVSSATTTLTDKRIQPTSVILFMPTTANALADIPYVGTVGDGTATLTHANNAQADRTFGYVVIG